MPDCLSCGKTYSSRSSLRENHYDKYPDHAPDDWDECPECGNRYDGLGHHWMYNPDHRIELSERQHEIITGSLMGDGWLYRSCANPSLQVEMITPEYLYYLDGVFGVLSTGVDQVKTSTPSDSDVYRWCTRSLPELRDYMQWYDNGQKIWPENLNITPTVLTHWYCGDGYFHNKGCEYIEISMSNEAGNYRKIESYFDDIPIPKPNNWSHSKRDTGYGGENLAAVWNVEESRELWEYMLLDGHGIPPGFEYKWPCEYRCSPLP